MRELINVSVAGDNELHPFDKSFAKDSLFKTTHRNVNVDRY